MTFSASFYVQSCQKNEFLIKNLTVTTGRSNPSRTVLYLCLPFIHPLKKTGKRNEQMLTQYETMFRVQLVLNQYYHYRPWFAQHLEQISKCFLRGKRNVIVHRGVSYLGHMCSSDATKSYESRFVPVNLSTAEYINR